jgi:hypothetical protein
MRARWILGLWLVVLGACADDSSDSGTSVPTDNDASTGERECYDPDEDGFGPYCAAGRDCDEDDPLVTDLCYRCADIEKDCPCEPGTEPVTCKPEDEKVEGGLIVCSEGTYWCRDGAWSDCERIAMYTMFIPD